MPTYSNSPLTPLNSAAYIDANGEPQTADNVTEITNLSSTLNAGWYVVTGSNVQTGTLTCNGEVHLILADGAKLTAAGEPCDDCPAVEVKKGEKTIKLYNPESVTFKKE